MWCAFIEKGPKTKLTPFLTLLGRFCKLQKSCRDHHAQSCGLLDILALSPLSVPAEYSLILAKFTGHKAGVCNSTNVPK